MPNLKKPAMAECQGCHYRFPKPDMEKVVIFEGGGYTPPRTTTRLNKKLEPVGYSQSQGVNRQGRKKTLWFCKDCYEKRKADIRQQWIFGIISALVLLLGFFIFQAVTGNQSQRVSSYRSGNSELTAAAPEYSGADGSQRAQASEEEIASDGNSAEVTSHDFPVTGQTAVAEASSNSSSPSIGSQSSPGGVRTSNVLALRAAVVAAIVSGENQSWSHFAESGSVIVQGIDPSSQCPILSFTVNEEGWASIPVPVCQGQSITQ